VLGPGHGRSAKPADRDLGVGLSLDRRRAAPADTSFRDRCGGSAIAVERLFLVAERPEVATESWVVPTRRGFARGPTIILYQCPPPAAAAMRELG
jgi:hypothetical protein